MLRGPFLDETAYLACCEASRLVSFLRLPSFTWRIRRVTLFGCACLRLVWDHLEPEVRRGLEKAEEMADRNKRAAVPALASDEAAWSAWQSIVRVAPAGSVCPGQLIHDIFGNPFRPVKIDPEWLTGLGGAVPRLARELYDGRHWAELPVLGDALEDAGCTDDAILAHLRGPGPHARGCRVLDALLGLP
jgi:hypothetical protein